MESRTCGHCGTPINLLRSDARFCSTKCRVYAARKAKNDPIPAELRGRDRWVRWMPDKRPVTVQGRPASSTDPRTWTSYRDAADAAVGAGLGFVLNGDGLACVDLDGVLEDGRLDPRAEAFLASLEPFYVEVSPSGRGIHAWLTSASPDGRKVYTLPDGLKVEWYSDARYITVTGRKFGR